MEKKSLKELIKIAKDINLRGIKTVTKDLGITDRTWRNWIKGTDIKFDKYERIYTYPILESKTEPIDEKLGNSGHIDEPENKLDVPVESTENEKLQEKGTEEKEEIKNGEKPKGDVKEYVKQPLMLDKVLIKALKCKALTENVSFEELVRDLLKQSVENKYYMGVS